MTTQQHLAAEVASRLRQLADMVEKSDAHIVTFTVRAELDHWRADIAILGGSGVLNVPQFGSHTHKEPST